jgi:hypothetical protein
MAAITTAVNRRFKGTYKQRGYVMTASTTIPKGAIVAVVAATGLVINAVSGTVNPVVGIALETVTSPSGTETTKIQVGFDAEWLFAASSITQAMVGEPMLVVDNNTVDETSATSAVVGMLTEYVSTTSGWVNVTGLTGSAVI